MVNNKIRLFGYYGGKLRFSDDLEILVEKYKYLYEIYGDTGVFMDIEDEEENESC
ncbi:MAG: hypothetical protein K2K46_01965 [Lachnospiraceae bacterium]|nr:hypothetical protein [Lachnospiraceae bacterium]